MRPHTLSLPDAASKALAPAACDVDLHENKTVPALAVTPAEDTPGASSSTPAARPLLPRALTSGIELVVQSPPASKLHPAAGTTPSREEPSPPAESSPPPPTAPEMGVLADGGDAATTSCTWPAASSAAQPPASLLFSGPDANQALSHPSGTTHTSSLSASDSQPVPSLLLSAPSSGSASPRTPPNLRLEIPPQEPPPGRDGSRAPFAPDPENEGICTEVGSLGQEIQLESGDHLNALERIYLYTQSKATFHRIFMSRALPTYLNEVTPLEAVEYVLPLLGGLAIDEEERVKETFVAELLVIIWWFFSTCRLTDQELDPAPPPEPDPDAPPPTEPPLVSVQSFSAVLASLLLSNNPNVSAIARGTVVELLGRTRWIVNHPGETAPQITRYCESMRSVGEWSAGLLGPTEARMIQLEIIYGVIIDLGRLDLNAEEMGQQQEDQPGEGRANIMYEEEQDVGQVDISTPEESSVGPTMDESVYSSTSTEMSTSGSGSVSTDTSGSGATSSKSSSSGSAESRGHPTFSASDFVKPNMVSLPDSALTPTPTNSKSYADALVAGSGSTPAGPSGVMDSGSGATGSGVMGNGSSIDSGSGSSLNLPELSPGESSSRSSVASPAEPISPPAGGDYVGSLGDQGTGSLYGSLAVPEFDTSSPSTPGAEDLELSWYSASEKNGGFLRRGLNRGLSTMSAATSGIDPEDYADAEDWEDGVDLSEDVVDASAPRAEAGADAPEAHPNMGGLVLDVDVEAGVDEGTELGDPLVNEEYAYIDDGAAAEEAAIGRVASMSLIAAVTSSGVVDDEIYALFIEEVMRVSMDPVYWVRSETSYALGTLAKVVGEGSVESDLLPVLEALMTDTETHVRQASVFAIPPVLRRLSPRRRRQVAMQHMLQLCEDQAESVRTGALQVLAEVIHTFREDEGGPPEEFVDFFLKGEHNQIRAALPAPTPPPQDIWGEATSYFPAEPNFPEPDRALICAFNLPAVAEALGPTRWGRLSHYYAYLAEESWHTPKVRSTLAASAGEIARIIGPDAALRDVVPVWWTCVSRGEREAKIKAMNALPVLLEALDNGGKGVVAKKMEEAWANGGSLTGWKEREAFAKQLPAATRTLSHHGAVLCRIFKSGLEDRVAATREAVIIALPVLHEVLEGDEVHTRIARDDLFAFAESGAYRNKTTFLACCRALVESPKGAWILADPRFSRDVSLLAMHSVVDVRIGLGRLLTTICERHTPRRDERPVWLAESLEKLSLDSSSDVRAFVHRAAYAELDLWPPVDVSKATAKIADSEFAEFSRPP